MNLPRAMSAFNRRTFLSAASAAAAGWSQLPAHAGEAHGTDPADSPWFVAFGLKMKVETTTVSTGGVMSVTRVVSQPGSGPPAHQHTREDEVFIILRGRYRFWQRGQPAIDAPAGSLVRQHKGMVHQYRNVGDEEGEHLLMCLPGGLEQLFIAVAGEGLVVPRDMKRVVELSARYGLTYAAPIADR